MKAVKETIRKYYKYSDTPEVLVDLYASNNQSYIDSTSKHFVVGSVTAWSTTQTYVLNQPISAKDITATSIVPYVQSNAGWTVKISATTTSGETITILERDHGYGQQTTLTNTIDFNPLEQITSITIYAYCYRSSDRNCYGSINIGLTFTDRQIVQGTEQDYDFYKDTYEYSLHKELIRKYYKYDTQYEQDALVNLADSNNSNYISNNNFNVQNVTWWGTDQTYTFNEAFYANKLVVTIAHNAQGSARWDAVLVSINDNSQTLVNTNYGWGANTTNTYTINLDDYMEIRNVRIYVHITRSHTTYCYGGINIGIKADEVIEEIVETTEQDYDFYKDVDVYKAIKF